MKKLLCFALVLMSMVASAQTGSEIYLFDIVTSRSKVSIKNPINVTNHPGYDNQPFFHTSKPILYYSSFNDEGRSDIMSFNYEMKESRAFTKTSEREYSPTLTPDSKFISCIIQRDNGAQDLGKYPIEGGDAITLIDSLIIGYHAWANNDNLILFVLGDTMTLQWYDLIKEKSTILDTNIGRSLHRIPGENAMSYVKKSGDTTRIINRLDISTQKISAITKALPGREDLTWTNDGKILMSDGQSLFYFDSKAKAGWKPVDESIHGLEFKGITRLAISKDNKKLAVVVSE